MLLCMEAWARPESRSVGGRGEGNALHCTQLEVNSTDDLYSIVRWAVPVSPGRDSLVTGQGQDRPGPAPPATSPSKISTREVRWLTGNPQGNAQQPDLLYLTVRYCPASVRGVEHEAVQMDWPVLSILT